MESGADPEIRASQPVALPKGESTVLQGGAFVILNTTMADCGLPTVNH